MSDAPGRFPSPRDTPVAGVPSGRPTAASRSFRHWLALFAILLTAFALRVGVCFSLNGTVYGDGLLPDEDLYHALASRLARGEAPPVVADFPRLPVQVFALVYRVLQPNPWFIRLLNVGLGTLVCGLVYVLGRRLFGRQVGLLAALLCAVNTSLVYFSVSALKTCLGLGVFMTCVLLLVQLWKAPSRSLLAWALALGFALGALLQVRANGVLIALVLPPLLWCYRPDIARRHAALVVLLGLMACTGTAALLGGATGPRASWDLYIGNNPGNDTPYPAPVSFASPMPSQLSVGFVIEAARRMGRPTSEAEAARYFESLTAGTLLHNPAWALRHAGQKLLALLHESTRDENQDIAVIALSVRALKVAFLPSWLLLAMGLTGLLGLPRGAPRLLGTGLFVAYALSILPFFAGERLRAPLLPIAACYAAAGMFALVRDRRPVRPVIALCCLALLAHMPVPGAADRSRALNMHALLLFDQGRLSEAETFYRASASLKQADSPGAHLGLAAIADRRGRPEQALSELAHIADSYNQAASKYEWQGLLELQRGDLRAAKDAFERAVDIDGSRLNAYKGLFIAQKKLGDLPAARHTQAQLREVTRYFNHLSLTPP